MRDVIRELMKGILGALLISTVLFIVLIALYGCKSSFLVAEEAERKVMARTEDCYVKGVFDCSERYKMASAMLLKQGFKTEKLVQASPDGTTTHACLYWEKNGENGAILCKDGWRFLTVNK